jgi:hypothetical protein
VLRRNSGRQHLREQPVIAIPPAVLALHPETDALSSGLLQPGGRAVVARAASHRGPDTVRGRRTASGTEPSRGFDHAAPHDGKYSANTCVSPDRLRRRRRDRRCRPPCARPTAARAASRRSAGPGPRPRPWAAADRSPGPERRPRPGRNARSSTPSSRYRPSALQPGHPPARPLVGQRDHPRAGGSCSARLTTSSSAGPLRTWCRVVQHQHDRPAHPADGRQHPRGSGVLRPVRHHAGAGARRRSRTPGRSHSPGQVLGQPRRITVHGCRGQPVHRVPGAILHWRTVVVFRTRAVPRRRRAARRPAGPEPAEQPLPAHFDPGHGRGRSGARSAASVPARPKRRPLAPRVPRGSVGRVGTLYRTGCSGWRFLSSPRTRWRSDDPPNRTIAPLGRAAACSLSPGRATDSPAIGRSGRPPDRQGTLPVPHQGCSER